MSTSTSVRRFGVVSLFAIPVMAATLFVSAPQASAMSCSVIADQLSHQNDPLQDAKTRLTTCAKKYAKYDETLTSRSKSEWKALCEKNKTAYTSLLNNRQQILVPLPATRQRRLISVF